MYQQKFIESGVRALSAESADKAFSILEKENISLILLDILIPKQNGIQILRKLRENPDTKDIKVLAFSNLDDPNVKKQANLYNVIDYLIKTDYTPKQILAKVKKCL